MNHFQSPTSFVLYFVFTLVFVYADGDSIKGNELMNVNKISNDLTIGPGNLRHLNRRSLNVTDVRISLNSTSENLTRKKEIYIGLLLPFTFTKRRSEYKGGAKYYAAAFSLAVKNVNENKSLLPGYQVTYTWNDTRCNEKDNILAMYDQFKYRERRGLPVHGFIGLGCECDSAAKFASAMDVPVVSHMCSSPGLSNKNEYTTFARTYPLAKFVLPSLKALLDTFNWTRVAVITSSGSNQYQETSDELLLMLKKSVMVSYKIVVPPWTRYNASAEIFNQIMPQVKRRARIVIFHCDYNVAREGLLYAKRFGMANGSYVFIIVHLNALRLSQNLQYPYRWFTSHFVFTKGTNKEVKEAFKYALILGFSPADAKSELKYKAYIRMLKRASSGPPFYSDKYIKSPSAEVPLENVYLYDAVQVLALALNKTLNQNKSVSDGMAVVKNIIGLSYNSIDGNTMTINEEGDTHGYFALFTYDYEVDNGKQYMIISPTGYFKKNSSSNVRNGNLEYVSIRKIHWFSGKVPSDRPKCGFQGENCPGKEKKIKSNIHIVVAISVSTTVIAVIVLLLPIFMYRQYRLQRELTSKLWKVSVADLTFVNRNSSSDSSVSLNDGSIDTLENDTGILSVSRNDATNITSFESRTVVANFKGTHVAVKEIKRKPVELNREVLLELKQMRDLRHDNINQFIGACVESDRVLIVNQYALRGSLRDVLEDNSIKLETLFLLFLIYDIVKGMSYLHASEIKSHGNLKSSNCVIDSRWVLKITDFGLHLFKGRQDHRSLENHDCEKFLWRAPELLRMQNPPVRGTEKADVYSFAIILQECHTRKGPWSGISLSHKETIQRVMMAEVPPFRPTVSDLIENADGLRDLMKKCWHEHPDARPSFHDICKEVEAMMKANGFKKNIVDNMTYMMERYTDHLEDLVEQKTGELWSEKMKIESLLERMLPPSVAKQLKQGKEVEAETFQHVSIYFSDIVGFTELCADSKPIQVVQLLNDLYTLFDKIIKGYDVYKVETIGDAYMVVSGLPIRNEEHHASEIALMALHINNSIASFKIQHRPEQTLQLRIGINSGSVVAGVVGTTMPRFCLFGDTVNTASRMESTGAASKIHISESTKLALEAEGGFKIESRGPTFVKGKGEIKTYWLVDVVEVHKRRISEHDENMRCNNAKIGSQLSLTIFRHSPSFRAKFTSAHHSSGLLRSTPDASPLVLKKALFLRNYVEKPAILDDATDQDLLPLLNRSCEGANEDAIL